MDAYIGFVMLLNFSVSYLLLLGTNCLCQQPIEAKRALPAAVLSGVYSGVCLLPVPQYTGSVLLRIVVLTLAALMAFGGSKSGINRTAVFLLLMLAIGAITSGFTNAGITELAAAVACILILLLFRGKGAQTHLVTMELCHGGKSMRVIALDDTGNGLCDPVTGEPVIVVGAEVASVFTGLSRKQLSQPADSLHLIPGLRLIPYRTIGKERGFLLAMRFAKVKIGGRSGSWLVAFAPEGLGPDGRFQALTGRTI